MKPRIHLALLLVALLVGPVLGQGIDLTSNEPIQYDDATKEVIALGGARLTYGEYLMTAGEIRYNQETGVAAARGGIVITSGDARVLAEEGEYSTADGVLRLREVRAGRFPIYVSAESAEGTFRELELKNAIVYYGEPGRMTPKVTSPSITWRPGERIDATRAGLKLGSLPLLALPSFSNKFGDTFLDLSVKAGYRSRLGPYVNVTALAPVADGVGVGAGVGIFGARGLLIGPAARYERSEGDKSAKGVFRSGYISDGGDRGTDILGDPIGSNRGFVEWKHRQTSGRTSFTGFINYWSDSEIIRDFDRATFSKFQEPDSFLEVEHAWDNFMFSAFLRPQPNSFHLIQQRLPEITLDLLPSPVGGGLIHRGSVSAVRLQEDAVRTGTDRESDRIDLYYGLSRPWAVTPWLTLTPVAGGRITHYSDPTNGSANYTRCITEIGADLRARAWADFDYKNEAFGIDGLRHIVEPFAQYRSMPSAGNGRHKIPSIDRTVFATRLQPLGLGDIRNLDDMRDINTLRVGIDQRLLTKSQDGGTTELASLVLAMDRHFRRDTGVMRHSALQMEASLRPASWLRLETFTRVDVDDPSLQEFNAGVSIVDGRHWSVRAATHFLKGDLEEYEFEAYRRINEEFSLGARFRYDARTSSLYEQTYALRQNFRNLWSLEYQVSFHERLRRESGFHFRILVDFLKF